METALYISLTFNLAFGLIILYAWFGKTNQYYLWKIEKIKAAKKFWQEVFEKQSEHNKVLQQECNELKETLQEIRIINHGTQDTLNEIRSLREANEQKNIQIEQLTFQIVMLKSYRSSFNK